MNEATARETSRPSTKARIFIALPVPINIKNELKRLQTELAAKLPDALVRWTPVKQFHLTLVFLGNVDAGRLEQLTAATRESCAKFAQFRLRAERIGFFPNINAPKVMWVWAHDDWGELVRLQKTIARSTESFKSQIHEERFTAHLTIGRMEKLNPAQNHALGAMATEMAECVIGDWTADTVKIMRSEPAAGGHRHTRIAEIQLKQRE